MQKHYIHILTKKIYILSSHLKLRNSSKVEKCENGGFLNAKESVSLRCILTGTTVVTIVTDYTAHWVWLVDFNQTAF